MKEIVAKPSNVNDEEEGKEFAYKLNIFVVLYIIKWNFLYVFLYVCMSVAKYLKKYRTYSVKTNT